MSSEDLQYIGRIKNWDNFQHFKDRKPPWIKLYRDLLDDVEWHNLDPLAAKHLIAIWLIASEHDGNIPALKTLAFRLRLSEKQTISILDQLTHWTVRQCDINVISTRYLNDSPETETETETEREGEKRQIKYAAREVLSEFREWYEICPRKKAPGDAEKAYAKARKGASAETLLNGVLRWQSEAKARGDPKHEPYPATWLNKKQWLDEPEEFNHATNRPIQRPAKPAPLSGFAAAYAKLATDNSGGDNEAADILFHPRT